MAGVASVAPEYKAALEERARELCWSTKDCAKTFFPDRCYRGFAGFHDEIFKIIDDPAIQLAAIAAPRGTGKTSIISLAFPARHIIFRHSKSILMISATENSALLQSDNLKTALQYNQDIVTLFGSIKPRSRDTAFAKGCWETPSGISILARGSGQQTRGLIKGNFRPDLIIIDDLEDPQEQISDESRAKIERWFWDDIYFLPDKGKPYKIILLGTITHPNCLLQKLLDNPSWNGVRLELFDDNRKSLWPEYQSDAQIQAEYEQFEREGKLDLLYMNWRNIPVAKETAKFKPEYFKYYEEETERSKFTESVVIIDPAKTLNITSDDTAIVVIGLTPTGGIYVRDVMSGKFAPDQIYELAFDACEKYHCRVIGIEVTSLNAFITYPIKDAMLRRGRYYEIEELKPWASKEERVGQLESFYRRGLIFHNKTATVKLESRLLSYPRPKLWDCMDALAYIIPLLHLGERYGSPDWKEEVQKGEDEFSKLDEYDREHPMPSIQGWQRI